MAKPKNKCCNHRHSSITALWKFKKWESKITTRWCTYLASDRDMFHKKWKPQPPATHQVASPALYSQLWYKLNVFETWTCWPCYPVTFNMECVFNLCDGSLSALWLGTGGSGKEWSRPRNACEGRGKEKGMGQKQENLVMVKGNDWIQDQKWPAQSTCALVFWLQAVLATNAWYLAVHFWRMNLMSIAWKVASIPGRIRQGISSSG